MDDESPELTPDCDGDDAKRRRDLTMRTGPVLFRVMGAVLGLQLILGGLLTFGFISPEAHIIVGFLLFFLAIANLVVWFVTKPSIRSMQILSLVIVLLLVLQIILGFVTLGTGSLVTAFLHFINALAIFGATLSGTFMAMRWSHTSGMEKGRKEAGAGTA